MTCDIWFWGSAVGYYYCNDAAVFEKQKTQNRRLYGRTVYVSLPFEHHSNLNEIKTHVFCLYFVLSE